MLKVLACVAALAFTLMLASAGRARPIDITAEAPGVLLPTGLPGSVLSFDAMPIGRLPSYQFNGGSLSGGGAIENTSIIGMSAQPAGSGTGYLTTSYPSAAGATQLNFTTPEHYFGLYWGSIDSWNSITFVRGGQQIAAYSGTDVAGLTGLVANGDQQSPFSNRYINFDLGDLSYDEVVLSTANWGFEVDNIAFGDPPVRPRPGLSIATGASGDDVDAGFSVKTSFSGGDPGFAGNNIIFGNAAVLSGASAGGRIALSVSAVAVLPTLVPEPGTLVLLGASLCGFVAARRRRAGYPD